MQLMVGGNSNKQIASVLGIPAGPLVGKAYNFLLELRIAEGELGQQRATQELVRWAAVEGIPAAEPPDEDLSRRAASQ